ncbi:MAG: type II toxin-antitoxin system HicB family antitoxin [Nitrospinota bacterium]
MRYPVILEPGDGGAYSVMVPDLPGCFSHGDTYEEAVDNAREAIELHLFGLREAGLEAPLPRTVAAVRDNEHPEFEYAFVEIDPSQLGKGVKRVKARRIQVTIPPELLAAIDEERSRRGMDRSKWLQKAAWSSLPQARRIAPSRKGTTPGKKTRGKGRERSPTASGRRSRTTGAKAAAKQRR